MSKVRKYQTQGKVEAGPVSTSTPKYKVILDGKEVEFTDEELDNAWSNIAVKNILQQGGIKEDDLNARYSQFKDQAKSGTYSFDVAPSQTLKGEYEGGTAMLGTEKRIRGIDKIFGVKNQGKQMNTVNYYLPMQLKQLAQEKETQIKTDQDKLAADEKAKFGTDTEKKYAAIAQGHGFGALTFGEDYTKALNDPEKLKQILNLGYWNKDEASRRDLLTKSGSGLKDIYGMTPEELEQVETKYPGFTKKRENILKYYNPESNQFNFSNLPKFQDLYEYSNAQDAMEQDKYLFDANTLKSEQDLKQEKTNTDIGDITMPSMDDLEGYVPIDTGAQEEKEDGYTQIMNQRTEIDIDKANLANNSLMKTLFPTYKSGNKYFIAWHTKGGEGSGTDKYWVPQIDANGEMVTDDKGNNVLELVTYDWKNKRIVSREKASREELRKKYPSGFNYQDGGAPKEDIGHRLINLDKDVVGEKQSGWFYREPSSLKAEPGSMLPANKEGGILKAEGGMVFKYRDSSDINTYIQKIQQEKQVDLPTAEGYFKTWVSTGKIIPTEVKQQEVIAAPEHGEQKSTLNEWHSQSVKNLTGWESLSDVDKADLGALIGDIGAVALPGPIGQVSGVQGGLSGLYADVKRDGLDWGDVGVAGASIGLSAQALVPGLGMGKLPLIAKTLNKVVKSKTLMPVLRTALTGMGAWGAIKILDKGINQGFDNLTLEDMRILGTSIIGLKAAKNITQKQGAYTKQNMGENQVLPVEITTSKGVVKQKIVLSSDEMAQIKGGVEGKTSQQLAQEIIHSKIQKDANLSKLVGQDIKQTDISIPMKTSYGVKGIWNPKQRTESLKTESSGYTVDAPIHLQDTKLQQVKRFLYTGNPNKAQFEARQLPTKGEQTVYNADVTAQRVGKTAEGKFVKESSVNEINTNSKIELNTAKKVNEKSVDELINLPKIQNEQAKKLQTLRTSGAKTFPAEKKGDVEKVLKSLDDNLKKAKKASKDLEPTADPDMKRNLKDLIKNQEEKLQQLKKGISYKTAEQKKEVKLLPKQDRMGRQKKYLEDYAAGKTTEGKNPLSMERRQARPQPEQPKALNEPFKMKPTGQDKPKKGRKKKLAKGGVLFLWGGGLTPSAFNAVTEQTNKKKRALEEFNGALSTFGVEPSQAGSTVLPNKIDLNGQSTYQASGKTSFKLPSGNMDPIWSLKQAELLNSIRATKGQDTSVNVPIAQHMQEYMPTVPGSANLEQNYANMANTQRTQANLPQTADAGVNLQQRSQTESKLRDFEAEGKLKGLMMRQQGQEKRDALTTTYNQSRQQIQNTNEAQNAEKQNQERQRENWKKAKSSDLLSEFMQNRAQGMQQDKDQNQVYQDKLSEIQLTEDIENRPDAKQNFDELTRLTNLAQKNNGVLEAQDKLKYDKLMAWRNQLKNAQMKTLYSNKVAGKPYEAGTFQFNQSI